MKTYTIYIRLARDVWDADSAPFATRAEAEAALSQMHASFKAAGINDVPKSDYKIRVSK